METFNVRFIITIAIFFCLCDAHAQQVDSMYVNLYTDSLKKGTYNYINIDGHMSNGTWLPLDSTHLVFKSSAGKFYGNSLWLDRDCTAEKVCISVILKGNRKMSRDFVMYVKKREDDGLLKTEEQLLDEMKKKRKN